MINQYGPGPIIHGQDTTNPNRYIIQHNGSEPTLMTAQEIAAIPIRPQWFTGTANGLIATWPTREIAELSAQQRGTILGQILPLNRSALAEWFKDRDPINSMMPVLCDPHGRPLKAEP